jgi:hypothetical protein
LLQNYDNGALCAMTITNFCSFHRIGLVNALVGPPLVRIAAIAAIHGAALLAIYRAEYGPIAVTLALLTWVFLNFFWLTALRRPALAATLSLVLFESTIVLSQFKFSILEMTLSFFDMIMSTPIRSRFC